MPSLLNPVLAADCVSVTAPPTLVELINRIQSGDEAGFCELYAMTRGRLGRIIARIVCSPDHAAEVMQEVYLYVWQNARLYDPTRGTALGWLSMLAHRRAVDRVRAVTRSAARDHRDTLDSEVGGTLPDIADLGIARHDAAYVHRALSRLSSKQRDAIALTYLGGYTHREAAELLSVPLGTLKTRVRDGINSLRPHLAALKPTN